MKLTVVTKNESGREIQAIDGAPLVEVLKQNNFYVPASCGGSMACSTCHVMLDADTYANLPPPSEDEEDVLDMIPQLTATSRLSCQVICRPEMDGGIVTIPNEMSNLLAK